MKPPNQRIFKDWHGTSSNSQLPERDKHQKEYGRQIVDSDDLRNIEEAFKFPDEK